MKGNNFPLWKKLLIGGLLIIAFTAIIVIVNINEIINYNLTIVPNDIYTYIDTHFGYNALSEEEKEDFKEKNLDKLAYCDINTYNEKLYVLYTNKLYVETFGKRAFDNSGYNSSYKDSKEAFYQREVQLRQRAYVLLYPTWKKEYNKYMRLSKEENSNRQYTASILYFIIIICGISIYLLSCRKIRGKSKQVKNLATYYALCEIINCIIVLIPISSGDTMSYYSNIWITLFLLSSILLSCIRLILYENVSNGSLLYFPVFQRFIKTGKITSEASKRFFIVFISYPLLYAAPIPYYIGLAIFTFYILPITFIFTIVTASLWVIKGNKVDTSLKNKETK